MGKGEPSLLLGGSESGGGGPRGSSAWFKELGGELGMGGAGGAAEHWRGGWWGPGGSSLSSRYSLFTTS